MAFEIYEKDILHTQLILLNDPKFLDKYATVCRYICTFWTIYSLERRLCLNFRVITANILGALKFRTFTIPPVSVASDSDSDDVILTRTEPGDVIFTGSEESKDVMITGETSSKLI